ncbi:MAG: ankyrin repeat domain-containing protein [Myxococcales bacterium]
MNAAFKKLESDYERMVEAARQEGVQPPLLHADGGIELIPFTVRRNPPDWNAKAQPLLYVEGFELPDPLRSIGPAGKARTPNAVREALAGKQLPEMFEEFTALHLAAEADNAAAVEVLVSDFGLDPTATNAFGDSALHVACTEGSWDAARVLLKADATCLFQLNGSRLSPLGMAALANRPSGVRLLAKAGAKILSGPIPGLEDWRDSCELLVAAEYGHREFCEALETAWSIDPRLVREARATLGANAPL